MIGDILIGWVILSIIAGLIAGFIIGRLKGGRNNRTDA